MLVWRWIACSGRHYPFRATSGVVGGLQRGIRPLSRLRRPVRRLRPPLPLPESASSPAHLPRRPRDATRSRTPRRTSAPRTPPPRRCAAQSMAPRAEQRRLETFCPNKCEHMQTCFLIRRWQQRGLLRLLCTQYSDCAHRRLASSVPRIIIVRRNSTRKSKQIRASADVYMSSEIVYDSTTTGAGTAAATDDDAVTAELPRFDKQSAEVQAGRSAPRRLLRS